MSMDAMGAASWKQPLQPSSNHNSHKHNWNFIERKTTGSKFLDTTIKRVRVWKPCRRYMITGSSLFYTGTKSVQTDPQKRLSHAKLCTPPRPLPMDAWKFAFDRRKQQEKLYNKTETDGANKALLFQLAWLLTVLVQVMRGNVTCHPIGLVVSWRWGLSPLVTTNETEPEP